jgi:DNA-binding NarL/FixJ family response regulator
MKRLRNLPLSLFILILVQLFCSVIFMNDVISDFMSENASSEKFHIIVEAVASLSLFGAIVFETRYLTSLVRRRARAEKNLATASLAIHDIIEMHFEEWGLSPAEHDVGIFLVKGMTISEIAELRGNAEGTVKAHLNAIYRKSGTRNKSEVLSVILDDLIDSKTLGKPKPGSQGAEPIGASV